MDSDGLPIRYAAIAVAAIAAFAQTPSVAAKVGVGSLVERVVTTPGPGTPISDLPEDAALRAFRAYADALAARRFDAAYAMLRLSLQATLPRYDWEMAMRNRGAVWADADLTVARISWYIEPAGQPTGLYVAIDFSGTYARGDYSCGYVVLHRAAPAEGFTVVRTDTSDVPAALLDEGIPKPDILRQLPCYLGPGIATALTTAS